jgi:alpha-beta hydrolase superfamily lysophospholipase
MKNMRFSEDRIEKLTCSDGIQRDIHIWEAKKPRAVFLTIHGLMDHGGAYLNPALYFKEHQISMAAHDQHGHDRKRKAHCPRFEVFLDDLELMVIWVKQNYPGLPIFIMGHSMGGLIATHYGLKRLEADPLIKGFVISSPYYMNAVKVPGIMLKSVGILSAIVPRMTTPTEDFLPYTTRDQEVYQRHRKDIEDHIKAPHVSVRLGNELLKAQQWIPGKISKWKHPLMVIVAGDDKIADAEVTRVLLGQINQDLVTELYYPENYHENFNELNRDEIFGKILEWVEKHI